MTVCAVLAAILLFGSASFAAEPPEYSRYTLNLPGRLMSFAAEDLNGDGLKDIVVFSVTTGKRRPPERLVSVFYQKKGGFSSEPDQSWPLDPEAAAFDVGESGGRKAIMFLTPQGLYAYMQSGGSFGTKPKLLIRSESVFSQPDMFDLPRWPLSAGGGVVLIPEIDRLAVYSENGGFKHAGYIPWSARTSMSQALTIGGSGGGSLTVSHKIPAVKTLGFNAPSGADLFVTYDDNADVWQRERGGYAEAPYMRFRPGLLDSSRNDPMESAEVMPVDLEGGGRRDIIVTKTAGGVAQTKSLVFVYRRKADGTFPDKPSQTIITEGVVGPRVADVNGDGRADILLPSIKMGISNFVNMLTSRQINMTIGIYLQRADGTFPDRPTREKAVSFKLDVGNLGRNTRPVTALGRFTKTPGYGLAVVAKEDQVAVYLPDRYSIFSDRPGLKLKVDAPTDMELADLNGDGIDDIVMTYKGLKEEKRVLNIFLSK